MLNVKEVIKVASLEQTLHLLREKPYIVVAGGTDVLPKLRAGAWENTELLDISSLQQSLSGIYLEDGCLCIGAMCTHAQIQQDPLVQQWCSVLCQACRTVGSAQIRRRGTLGGNLVNASPASDTAPVLAAAGAQALLVSAESTRFVPVQMFATGPGKTCRMPDELLTQIRIPLYDHSWQGKYIKIGARNALVIAVASAAVLSHPKFGIRIACGSVGPTVLNAGHCEKLFTQPDMKRHDFYQALQRDLQPIDDVRASAQYRMDVLTNIIYQLYQEGEVG